MSITKKIIGIFGTVNATGVGAVLYNHFKEDHTMIISNLKKAGYEILDENTSTQDWTTAKSDYEYYSKEEWGKINNFEEMKRKCKSVLFNKQKNSNDYSIAKRFCVKRESMLEMITRNKYEKISDYDPVQKTNRREWEKKVNALKNAPKGTVKINVDIGDNMDQAVKALSDECAKIKVSDLYTYKEPDFENKFLIFKEWCATEKTD